MSTVLITGGKVSDAVKTANQFLDDGQKVIVFHEFPWPSVAKVPGGVEMVFKLDPEGATPREIAAIYGADAIVDLDSAPQRQNTRQYQIAPQHLY